jgi:hypothetical protein
MKISFFLLLNVIKLKEKLEFRRENEYRIREKKDIAATDKIFYTINDSSTDKYDI